MTSWQKFSIEFFQWNSVNSLSPQLDTSDHPEELESMNSAFLIDGGDLPTLRDVKSSCNQVMIGFLNVVILVMRAVLQTFMMGFTIMKSIQNIHNVGTLQLSKVLFMVTAKIFNWDHVIFLSDVYNVLKFVSRFGLSIAITGFVLSLKGTYIWGYFVDTLAVPILAVCIPLQVCSHRQFLGPPFVKHSYVTAVLWFGNTLLIYFIVVAFVNVHLYHLRSERVDDVRGKETDNMDFALLLALLEVPISLTVVSWKAFNINSQREDYNHTQKNALLLNWLHQCLIPVSGFSVFSTGRSGFVYELLYLQQLFSWGNSVMALSVYVTYEVMVLDTFPLLGESEAGALSEDDVCPVCLLKHTADSCRLACGHMTHTACLVSMVQTVATPKCPMCRQNIALKEPSSRITSQRNLPRIYELREVRGSESSASRPFSAAEVAAIRNRLRLHQLSPHQHQHQLLSTHQLPSQLPNAATFTVVDGTSVESVQHQPQQLRRPRVTQGRTVGEHFRQRGEDVAERGAASASVCAEEIVGSCDRVRCDDGDRVSDSGGEMANKKDATGDVSDLTNLAVPVELCVISKSSLETPTQLLQEKIAKKRKVVDLTEGSSLSGGEQRAGGEVEGFKKQKQQQ